MRAPSLFVWFPIALALLDCTNKPQGDAGVVLSSTSSESTGDPTGGKDCSDGTPVPGDFCFKNVPMPTLTSPLAAAGGYLDGETHATFVVLTQLTDELITIDHTQGKLFQGAAVKIGHHAERQLRFANFEGSIHPELVVTSVNGSSGALPNEGGVLGPFKEFDLPGMVGLGRLVPIDIDGDGFSEVIKGTNDTARLWIGEGGKWLLQEPSFSVEGCKVLWDAAVGDFNRDGLEDVAFIGSSNSWDAGGECDPIPAMRIKVVLATGDSALLKEVGSIPTGQTSAQIVTGHLDGDGVLDLAVASGLDEGVIALKGQGDGQFAAPVQVVNDGQRVLIGDYDGDGIQELATNRYTPDALVAQIWFIDTVFNEATLHQVDGANALLLASTDINGDGVDDLATMSILDPGPHFAILISEN